MTKLKVENGKLKAEKEVNEMKSEPVPRTSTRLEEKKEDLNAFPKNYKSKCLLYFTFTIAFYKLPSVRLNTTLSRITSSHAKQSKS